MSRWMYDLIYRFSKPGWDRDSIPPQVAWLAEKAGSGGRVLDLGCGTGTHSIYLAREGGRSGLTVVGIDFSSQAIAIARHKASQAGLKVDFLVGDVTKLNFLHNPFDVVLDVGCFHGLNWARQAQVAQSLIRLTHPGTWFLLWAFDEGSHFGIGLSQEQVRQVFEPDFLLERVESSQYNGGASAWYWLRRKTPRT